MLESKIVIKGEVIKNPWSVAGAIATLGPFQKNNTGRMTSQKRCLVIDAFLHIGYEILDIFKK